MVINIALPTRMGPIMELIRPSWGWWEKKSTNLDCATLRWPSTVLFFILNE